MERLLATAGRFGGVAGAPFAIYRGHVNEDSDGPVEVCVPISHPASEEVAMRREPAHREAYVRLREAQVEFPQILSAFDAVACWIDARGLCVADEPRGVLHGLPGGGAGREVCDVAFPIA